MLTLRLTAPINVAEGKEQLIHEKFAELNLNQR